MNSLIMKVFGVREWMFHKAIEIIEIMVGEL